MDVTIEELTPERAAADLAGLSELLCDAVAGGASVGFLPPLSPDEARDYWQEVFAALRDGSLVLLTARRADGRLVGTVQLQLVTRPNGRHRAEVAKLLVHSSARRQGIGRALMAALEAQARTLGRTTLVLDTRQGDSAEQFYRTLGYQRAGIIPAYARSADGRLDATAVYYRLLTDV